jgi:hypothetical protein
MYSGLSSLLRLSPVEISEVVCPPGARYFSVSHFSVGKTQTGRCGTGKCLSSIATPDYRARAVPRSADKLRYALNALSGQEISVYDEFFARSLGDSRSWNLLSQSLQS